MLGFLRLCNDDYTLIDLVGKVAELAEKYPFVVVRFSLLFENDILLELASALNLDVTPFYLFVIFL